MSACGHVHPEQACCPAPGCPCQGPDPRDAELAALRERVAALEADLARARGRNMELGRDLASGRRRVVDAGIWLEADRRARVRLEADRAALAEALKKYGRHEDGCSGRPGLDWREGDAAPFACDCGLAFALRDHGSGK